MGQQPPETAQTQHAMLHLDPSHLPVGIAYCDLSLCVFLSGAHHKLMHKWTVFFFGRVMEMSSLLFSNVWVCEKEAFSLPLLLFPFPYLIVLLMLREGQAKRVRLGVVKRAEVIWEHKFHCLSVGLVLLRLNYTRKLYWGKSSAGAVPPTKLFSQSSFTLNRLCQGIVPTQHQAALTKDL